MSTPALQATGLIKRFGDLTAVDGLDLQVQPGTCLALLGPNGAGLLQVLPEMGILAVWTVIPFLLAIRIFRWG